MLEVQIAVPVGSWETLFDVVEQHLGHGLVGAIVPEHPPGRSDAEVDQVGQVPSNL